MQLPRGLLRLAMLQLAEKAVLEWELVVRTVLMLEEEVEQVVKKAPPFFFL